jgi:hypothetical protein
MKMMKKCLLLFAGFFHLDHESAVHVFQGLIVARLLQGPIRGRILDDRV